MPSINIGLCDGENNHPIKETPKRNNATNNTITKSKKANLATTLFELKNSCVPSTYLVDENGLIKPDGPSDTFP